MSHTEPSAAPFDAEEAKQLRADDSEAFRNVCLLLLAVVTTGTLLMAFTVLLVWR